MVLPFLFVKWTGYWYIQGCCLKRSPSAWRTDLWIPALRKIHIGISFLVPHHGMNTADSFIRCLFITYCFYPYDIFLWRFETLCGLVRFFKCLKNSQCKLFGSLENPNMYGFGLVRFLLVCCFFLCVIKLLESIKLFVLPQEKQHLPYKWNIRLHAIMVPSRSVKFANLHLSNNVCYCYFSRVQVLTFLTIFCTLCGLCVLLSWQSPWSEYLLLMPVALEFQRWVSLCAWLSKKT